MDSDRAFQPTPIAEPSLSTAFALRATVGTKHQNDSGAESVYRELKRPSVTLSCYSAPTARIILRPEAKLLARRCATGRKHPFIGISVGYSLTACRGATGQEHPFIASPCRRVSLADGLPLRDRPRAPVQGIAVTASFTRRRRSRANSPAAGLRGLRESFRTLRPPREAPDRRPPAACCSPGDRYRLGSAGP